MIINYCELCKVRERHPNQNICLCIGTFDLFHQGHLDFLNEAKEYGDILVVIVKGNNLASLKGSKRPIIDEKERANIIDNLKCTDYTIIANKYFDISKYKDVFEIPIDEEDRWKKYAEIIECLKPNTYVAVDTAKENNSFNSFLTSRNVKIKIVKYHKGISTTEIINKILK